MLKCKEKDIQNAMKILKDSEDTLIKLSEIVCSMSILNDSWAHVPNVIFFWLFFSIWIKN